MSTRPPEDRLAQLLRERAGAQPTHPISLTEVTGRARVIRRRRRTAVVAAAAAVVAAIAVPTAVLLNGQTASAPPTHQVTPHPSPSGAPTTAPTPPPDTRRAGALAALPAGAAPSAYTLGDRVHLAGGATSVLSPLYPRYAEVAAYHGGWLAFNEAAQALVQTDSRGRLVARHATSEAPLSVSQDGTQLAFWWQDQPGGRGHLVLGLPSGMSATEQRQATPPGALVQPMGIAAGTVYYEQVTRGVASVWTTDFVHPPKRLPGPDAAWAYDANRRLLLGSRAGDGRSRILDAATGRTLQTFPSDWQAVSFSPDGRLVLGRMIDTTGTEGDYALRNTLTGHNVATFRLTARGITTYRAVWESNGALVVDATDRGSEAILRLATGGRVERATQAVADSPAGYGVALP